MWVQLRWNTSLLVRSNILELFVNTLTFNDTYSYYKSENFLQTIQMDLSKKPKTFYQCFIEFLERNSVFNILKKRWSSWLSYTRYYWLQNILLPNCLKGYVLGQPGAPNVLTGPKHWWNLKESSFAQLLHICGLNLTIAIILTIAVSSNCFTFLD